MSLNLKNDPILRIMESLSIDHHEAEALYEEIWDRIHTDDEDPSIILPNIYGLDPEDFFDDFM